MNHITVSYESEINSISSVKQFCEESSKSKQFCAENSKIEYIGVVYSKTDNRAFCQEPIVKLKNKYYKAILSTKREGCIGCYAKLFLIPIPFELDFNDFITEDKCQIFIEIWNIYIDDENPIEVYGFMEEDRERVKELLRSKGTQINGEEARWIDFAIMIGENKISKKDFLNS